jgi:hypothetical protein
MLVTKASPEKPKRECVISGIPKLRKKLYIMAPGGKEGNPNVIPNRAREATIKTNAPDILTSKRALFC